MTSKPNRFSIKRVVAIFVAAMMIVVVFPLLPGVVKSQGQSFAASLVPMAGLVQFRATGSKDWKNVLDTQLINQGDEIRTGSDGFARLNTVTGVEIDVFPTTQIGVNTLSMGEDSGQTVNLYEIVGMIFANVKQTNSNDHIQVILPAAGVTVKGTKFYTFVSPSIHAAVFSQDHDVDVLSANGRSFTVKPDNFAYIQMKLDASTQTCTLDLLNAAKSSFVTIPLAGDQNKDQTIRDLMHDFLSGNLNPQSRAYLRQTLELNATDLSGMTVQLDEADLQEILTQIDKFNVEKLDLSVFLQAYRSHWEETYKTVLTDPLAPSTCGNGKQDTGETPGNCPDDFTVPSSCGNGVCETNRVGVAESVVSCPADCLPFESVARSCSALINTTMNPPNPNKATPYCSSCQQTPKPSGVGN